MDKKLLNRKLYKQVKRMDRQEMEEYLKDVYTEGFKDGAEGADFKIKLVEILNKTKGIGPKTLKFNFCMEKGIDYFHYQTAVCQLQGILLHTL